METLLLDPQRNLTMIDVNMDTIICELQAAAMLAATIDTINNEWETVPGVTAMWSPQDSLHPIALEGLRDGPCVPPVYFFASDWGSDLTVPQIQRIAQELVKLPGVINRMEPRQFDPSVTTGQADPVGIVPGQSN
jgi:hypothetical protein